MGSNAEGTGEFDYEMSDLKVDLKLATDERVLAENLRVLSESVEYILKESHQLREEIVDSFHDDRMKYSDCTEELKGSKFYPLLTLTMDRVLSLDKKVKYFWLKADQISQPDQDLRPLLNLLQLSGPEVVEMTKENPLGFMTKTIAGNRDAGMLNMKLDDLKREWNAAKNDIKFEIVDCIRLAQELVTRHKESLN